MNRLRNIYKVARGIIFTAIILMAGVYALLYVLLSMPVVQRGIKSEVEKELSKFLDTKVEISSIDIRPFNEVMVSGLDVFDKTGIKCLEVDNLGAGIRLWRLIREGRVELSYAEIIGLDAKIRQERQDSAFNIQFIIDAFQPKDHNKPPTKFDINLRNVVLRRCAVSFDREWQPRKINSETTDFNHFRLSGLKADLNIPQLSNDIYSIDLRRLSFFLTGGLEVKTLAFKTRITQTSLKLSDLDIVLPNTEIRPSEISLNFDSLKNIARAFETGHHNFFMIDNVVTPSDFSWIVPELRSFNYPCNLTVEATGNMKELSLKRFGLDAENELFSIRGHGSARHLDIPDSIDFAIDDIKISLSAAAGSEIAALLPANSGRASGIIRSLGKINLSATGTGSPSKGDFDVDCNIQTAKGDLYVTAEAAGIKNGGGTVDGEVSLTEIGIGEIVGYPKAGAISGDGVFSVKLYRNGFDGKGTLNISDFLFAGKEFGGLSAKIEKTGKDISLTASMENEYVEGQLVGSAFAGGPDSKLDAELSLSRFQPAMIGFFQKYPGYSLSGNLSAHLAGNNIDNLTGSIDISDFKFSDLLNNNKSLGFRLLNVRASDSEKGRRIRIAGDWLDGDINGNFRFKDLPVQLKNMARTVLPSLIDGPETELNAASDMEFSFNIRPDNSLTEFFNLPFRLLVDIPISGAIDGSGRSARLDINIPYIQQGRNKLVHDTRIVASVDGESGTAKAGITSSFPAKKGEMTMNVDLFGQDDNIFSDLIWETPENHAFDGKLSLDAKVSKDELSRKHEFKLNISPSTFDFGTARWNIDKSTVTFDDGILSIDGLKIWHENQFVDIRGKASKLESDSVVVKLADIDIGYIFDTLNINYVTFGGTATGEITASGAFSSEPVALTKGLNVKELMYNGAVLGDAILKSEWVNDEKKVAISADITSDENRKTLIDGGIWVTRDSLSFSIDADRVPVSFLSPFMSAFSSGVEGRASGHATLYGTFSDIDLTGKIHADSIALKLDFTNVVYSGADSVYLYPGRIEIPSFRLYDRNGNSALLTGELKHRFFHDPEFNFKVSDARNLLCFDTNSKINPDWYGTIYGNGSASVKGWPGVVGVSIDMAATGQSSFTFVLNDTQAAEDYRFLTFSDRRKEEAEKLKADSVPAVLAAFRKKISDNDDRPSKFMIDIRGSLTPSTLMTLVMDPVAGDKITARGSGNIQLDYDSESEDIQMFGKYFLEDGNYNFSLQDLILRDFKIRRGSSISFNGDPYNARLNITASYRVNTNLTDLDKSFATDRELARTNVPVDALLMVEGEMQHPDISFDVELPTLTRDVERKVKSIISTDDMMSRQIIYLLALNRFYTPEYMGSSSNGGELASVASSTLSSQLSNMLGQLTDKFTVAPSFRSDKGDFSDLEVDVALSSRLLNNRLLVNGNFGYRDRSTSSTTFVGDFDLEYILNRNGNLRLKAYNHFNDQNYYLRQALTTQGLGVIYRRDFDNPFTFLKRKKKNETVERNPEKEKSETVISEEEKIEASK